MTWRWKRNSRRKNFFVKQRLQFSYMLLLAGGTAVGGVVYALVLRALLQERVKEVMYSNHSEVGNLWQVLYPVVLTTTLALLVTGLVVLFLLLELFAWRVTRAARELSARFQAAAEGRAQEAGGKTLAEFGQLGAKTVALIAFYQLRWSGIGRAAAAGSSVVEALGQENEPGRRLAALAAFDETASSNPGSRQ